MAVARVPAIMPHVSSSGGGDDLGSEDEVKVFKDEGEEEKRSSENLTEDKSDLIDLTESEVRIVSFVSLRIVLSHTAATLVYFPPWFFSVVFRVFATYSSNAFSQIFPVAATRLTPSTKCVHVCCRKRACSPVGPTRRREKRRRDPTSAPFSVSLLYIASCESPFSVICCLLLESKPVVSAVASLFSPLPSTSDDQVGLSLSSRAGLNPRYFASDAGNHIDANFVA